MAKIEGLDEGIAKAMAIAEKAIYNLLEGVCVDAIAVSRESHPYKNYTHNLEQSIACAVYHNGQMVFMDWTERDWTKASSEYQKLKGDGIHDDGSDAARDFLESYIPSKPWEVVFIAGAEYAQNVEQKYAGGSVRVLWGSFTFIDRNLLKEARKVKIK